MYLKEPITLVEQKWSVEDAPVVSVFNWVYNHNNYIRESIKSILMQKTAFPVEIIIHDDASNDGSTNIIKEYELKYPHLFKNILHIENQWSQGKSVMDPLFEKPRGKYIGLNHGDDYWTDPYKLQKQVDFLEANPEYVMTFHDVKILTKDGKLHDNFLTKLPVSWETAEDLARYGQYIQTNTVLFRNVIQNIPEIFRKYPFGDFALELYIAQFGKIKYFDEPMSVYRYQVGIHSTLAASEQARIFHFWMLPLWLYFSETNNKKLASIIMGRIFEYLNTVKDSEDGLLYAQYLCGHLKDESFPRFLLGTQRYYNDKIHLEINDGIDRHLKNASIIYLIKVIIYKLRMVLTIKWK